MARTRTLLAGGARLLTLHGPAGIGKTRVALELVDQGARLVELADATTRQDAARAVVEALAGPLGAGEGGTDAAAIAALAALAEQERPVVLDTFEHLVAAVATAVHQWLTAVPRAQLIVTSRERLRIPDEIVHELAPLQPSDGEALFLARARAIRHDYAATPADQRLVAEIVARLDGNPLAIELAAARANLLSPKTLLARLDQRFQILRCVHPGAGRHATLWDAIDASWRLLDSGERTALMQCSVFAGAFTLEAAEGVIELDLSGASVYVLDAIQALRDKSLLRCDGPSALRGELSFGLSQSVRAFAAARLADPAASLAVSSEDLHRRHAEWFGQAAERWVIGASGGAGGEPGSAARDRLELARDDLVAIAERALAAGEVDVALRALLTLEPVAAGWSTGEPCAQLLAAALSVGGAADPLRARAQVLLGELARTGGQLDAAQRWLEQAQELAVASDLPDVAARATARLGIVCHEQGRLGVAGALHQSALDRYRALGDTGGEGRALLSLAILHNEQGRFDDAQIHYEWALSLLRKAGDGRSAAIVLCNLGDLHREQRRLGEASSVYQRALRDLRAIGDRRVEGVVLGNLGATQQEQGRFAEAGAYFDQAIRLLRDSGDGRLEAVFGGYAAALARERGDALEGVVGGYRDALHALEDAGDRRYRGVFGAHLGSALGGLGDGASAQATLRGAHAELETLGDAALLSAFTVHEALASGDVAAIRRAVSESAPDAAASDEVRYALRLAARYLGDEGGVDDAAPVLVVSGDGGSVTPPGAEAIDLRRRGPMRRLVVALAVMREEQPGVGLTVDALLEAGWPGERVLPEAGANRVYVALATLRKLGLREVLLSREDGYLFDPGVALTR